MHDNDNPCCSSEQQAWIDLVQGLRSHLAKHINKKPQISLTGIGGLIELTSYLIQLHANASAFDETCQAVKARQLKRQRLCE
ncbi:hypothetical protein C4577_03570 [Candidatus Parcubacteria bacterium]|nr:MAG: hypothetical protein C4577_03570 [Candidatus Parcubacteria bacterium]